jgi:hypothetical protein
MEEIIALIRRLANERFYGALTLKFEAGQVVVLQKQETIKPHNYRDNRGNNSEPKTNN